MKKALALILSTTAMLFLASGVVVGCGSDDDDDDGGNPNDDAGMTDAGADASNPETDSSVPPPPGSSPFGDVCESDDDCDDGLICLTAEGEGWWNGGPAGGFCTLPCADDPDACDEFPNSLCVPGSSADEAYCFEGCQRGTSVFGGDKCHNRINSACTQYSRDDTACLPTCGFDGECPEGRFCDIAVGVCVDELRDGLPFGAECDPEDDQCVGVCITLGTGYSVCSGLCTFGSPSGCMVDPRTDEIPSGAGICLPLFDLQNDDVGDVGLCIQRCDCNGTCESAQSACDPFEDPEIEEDLQAKGLCVPKDEDSPGLACELGDGGTDSGTAPTDAGDAAGGDAPDASDGG